MIDIQKNLAIAAIVLATSLLAAGCAGDSSDTFLLAGSSPQLQFSAQPTNAVAGANNTDVTISVLDTAGNVVSNSAGVTITVELADNPAGGALIGGNQSVTTTTGIAVFNAISLDKTGAYTLRATSPGAFGDVSSAFDVTPGALAQVKFVTPPQSAISGTVLPAVSVELLDAQNNRVTTSTATVALSVVSGPAGATIGGTPSKPAVAGLATFDDLILTPNGNYVLRASSGAALNDDSPTFTQSPGPIPVVGDVVITTSVANAAEGATLISLTVEVRDNSGAVDTTATNAVSLSLGQNPAGGVLSGTTTRAAAAGIATFNDLSIDKAGVAYTLTASTGGYRDGVSNTFDVTPATADHMVFVVQPTTTSEGATINAATQVRVEIRNANNVVETTATNPITISIGANPGSGTLSGTLTLTPISGVADFDTLSIDRAGAAYQLVASAGGLPAVLSSAFTIDPALPRKLGFVTADQPTDTARGAVINAGGSGQVSVEVLRSDSVRVGTATNLVTIVFGANPTGGQIAGVLTKAATAGVAQFTDLKIDTAGGAYTLVAFSGELTPAQSAAFTVTGPAPSQLEFLTSGQPTNVAQLATLNAPGNVTVRILDGAGALVTSATNAITLNLGVNPSGGILGGTLTKAAVAGVVDFGDLTVDAVGNGYKLTASAAGLVDALSAPFNVTAATAFKLDVNGNPAPTGLLEGATLQTTAPGDITVRIQDSASVDVTAASATQRITLSLASNPQGATLSGTVSKAAVNGVATFNDLSIDKAGTYTLLASSPSLLGAVGAGFAITAVAPAQMSFVVDASNLGAGATMIAPTVQLKDAAGANLGTPTSIPVTVSLATNPGNGSLGGTLTVNTNATGLATFSNLNIDNVGAGYRLKAEVPGGLQVLSSLFDVTGLSTSVNTLNFVTSPSNTTSGTPINGVQVEILDNMSVRTSGTNPITLVLASNPAPGGILRGTLTTNASSGLATFNGLSILAPGTYSLTAFAAGQIPATSASFTITPPNFTRSTYTLGGGAFAPNGLAAGDLDADGDQDLATCNFNATAGAADGSLSVFSNDAAGGFTELGSSPFATGNRDPESIAIADVVAATPGAPDGFPDIFTGEADAAGPGLALAGNNGLGTVFTVVPLTGPTAGTTFGVRAANVNRVEPTLSNTSLDVVFADRAGATINLWRNEGPPGTTYTLQQPGGINPTLTTPSVTAAVDLDGDGDLDVIVGNQDQTPGTVGSIAVHLQLTSTIPAAPFVLQGEGGGTPAAVTYKSGGIAPHWIEAGDVDGDGNPDLVVTHAGDGGLGNQGLSFVTVLLQNGNTGTFFGARIVNFNVLQPSRHALGDVNGDGALDLVVPDLLGGNVRVFLGRGDGDFTLATTLVDPSASGPFQAVVVDLNNDAKLDIAVVNRSSNTLSVWLQN